MAHEAHATPFCAACFAKLSQPAVSAAGNQQQQQTADTDTSVMDRNATAPTAAASAATRPAAPAANNTRTVLFVKELDRKNAVRFQEVPTEGQAPVCGTLYLQKWFCGRAQNVRMTVEVS